MANKNTIALQPGQSLREKIGVFFCLIFLSIFFLLIHSVSTSPLFIGSFSDSEVFMVLGKFFLKGKIPYVDYFDHKGPVIIFIEALGQLLHPDRRMGIFILQFVFLLFTLSFIYATSRRYLNQKSSLIVVLLTVCYYAVIFENGNRTEEYSLPFLFIPAYFVIRFILEEYKPKVLQLLLIGVCSGVLMWIRLNNMAVICACILLFFIFYIKNKDWKSLITLISCVLGGVLLVSLPIIVYFYSQDALYEMLYATFIFNFEYARNAGEFEKETSWPLFSIFRVLIVFSIPYITLLVGAFNYFRRSKNEKVIIFAVFLIVMIMLATLIGKKSPHYMIISLPVFTLGVFYFLLNRRLSKKKLYLLIGASFFLFLALTSLKFTQNKGFDEEEIKYRENVYEVLREIPINERNLIYAYRTSITFINVSEVKPYFRYFISQERHGAVDSKISEDINFMMKENSPKWLVIEYKGKSDYNPRFFKIRDEKYNLHFENELFELYKLKE